MRSERTKSTAAEEQENQPGYVRIDGEGLRKFMGGVRFCREEELTRAVLLGVLEIAGSNQRGEGFGWR